jgi:hypothetical protein
MALRVSLRSTIETTAAGEFATGVYYGEVKEGVSASGVSRRTSCQISASLDVGAKCTIIFAVGCVK